MWRQIRENKRRSTIFVLVVAMLLFGVGFIVSDLIYAPIGIFLRVMDFRSIVDDQTLPPPPSYLKIGVCGGGATLTVGLLFIAYIWRSGGSILLRAHAAQRAASGDAAELLNIVDEMAIASGAPKTPMVYIIQDEAPNAFAVGRNPESASIAVTSGLLAALNRDEIQAVIAHEMAHINNRDALFMTLLGGTIGAMEIFAGNPQRKPINQFGPTPVVDSLADISLFAPFLFIMSRLAHLASSAATNERELLADACAVQYTRNPGALASALEKIAVSPLRMKSAVAAAAPMYFAGPLSAGKADSDKRAGAAHRIDILRSVGKFFEFSDFCEQWKKSGKAGRRAGAKPV